MKYLGFIPKFYNYAGFRGLPGFLSKTIVEEPVDF